jgi:hypothetical protein
MRFLAQHEFPWHKYWISISKYEACNTNVSAASGLIVPWQESINPVDLVVSDPF